MIKTLKYPSVSIIFANYNGGDEPLECLKSIKNLNYPKKKIETIVVDNGSVDGSRQRILLRYSNIILKKNRENLGFAKAINQGIKIANGDYIFITNDDVVFEKESLRKLVNYSLKNPKVGILGGLMYKKNPPKKISTAGNKMNLLTGNVFSYPNPYKIKEPNWIPGCGLLVKRKVVEKIGILDDLFTYSFEDYDFCLRAKDAGYKIIYLPKAIFWHRVSTTANKNRKLTHYQWDQSKLRFTLKNLPILNIISICIFQTALIPIAAIAKRDHRIIPYAQAIIWNLKNLKDTLKKRRKEANKKLVIWSN